MVFLDTNILLGDNTLPAYFLISSVTLLELEEIKTSRVKTEEIKAKARAATRWLTENRDRYSVVVYQPFMLDGFEIDPTPDAKICACAIYHETDQFWTNDLLCAEIARNIFHLPVKEGIDQKPEPYYGYIERRFTDVEMADLYQNQDKNTQNLLINQYLIVKDSAGETKDIVTWNGSRVVSVKFESFKSVTFGTLKPLDDIQRCAFNSVVHNDISVLWGRAGSGKTTIPIHYIRQCMESGDISKLYVVYSFEPLKSARTLGYEKGSHEEKLLNYGSIGNILSSIFGDKDQVMRMLENGTLDIIPTANLRGMEFESHSAVLCTEAQNLDIYTIKTIIQRAKHGCKMIFEGDILEQKDIPLPNSGMERLIDVFRGHPSFGCVKLKNTYRSELTELADQL